MTKKLKLLSIFTLLSCISINLLNIIKIDKNKISKCKETFRYLNNKKLENNVKNIHINLEDLKLLSYKSNNHNENSLVSYTTSSENIKSYPLISPKTTFVSFWTSLNELGKALFIGFLSTAAVSVISTIGYGIYKGINNNTKESKVRIENKGNTNENARAEVQSGPGDYKLTLTITKHSEKNKDWYVYSNGKFGFENASRKIGISEYEQNGEQGKMTKETNGEFTFIFNNVKDPTKVTIVLKTGSNENKETIPFTLGDFLSGSKISDKKIYLFGDSEENSDKTNFKPKNNASPLGSIYIIKLKSSENSNLTQE